MFIGAVDSENHKVTKHTGVLLLSSLAAAGNIISKWHWGREEPRAVSHRLLLSNQGCNAVLLPRWPEEFRRFPLRRRDNGGEDNEDFFCFVSVFV